MEGPDHASAEYACVAVRGANPNHAANRWWRPDVVGSVSRRFFTVGHSSRTLEEFIELLRGPQVQLVVDVRKIPRSRAHPHFGDATLSAALRSAGIAYERIAELGGLRGKAANVPRELNGLWENQSFHNYADYALSDAFRLGFGQLLNDGQWRTCAVMCSEAVWWRCHRRIIADYLLAAGEEVLHLMEAGREERAHLTPGAVIRLDASVVYPSSPVQAGHG